MARVNSDTANLLSIYQSNLTKINKTVEQLSTGVRLVQPGDNVSGFEHATTLDIDRSSKMSKMQAIQSRLNWYEVGIGYMQEIRDLLSEMSQLAIHGSSGTASEEDSHLLDVEFQELKGRIASIVDGQGGANLPLGSFGSIPQFLGYSPTLSLATRDEIPNTTVSPANFFTAHASPGFSELPFISDGETNSQGDPEITPKFTGTADAGSVSSITLPNTAAYIDDVYNGMTLTITGGTGSGQSAEIVSYNKGTRVAQFKSPLTTALDNTSIFSIDSGKPNHAIFDIDGVTSSRFAEHVWGADNYRLDHLVSNATTFKALTQAEASYRTANSIPDTDLNPRTDGEKLLRRQLNIFDPEFGGVANKENSKRMLQQLERAIDQVSVFISREDSKASSLKKTYTFYQTLNEQQELGIQNVKGLKIAEATTTFNQLQVAHNMIFELAARISQNYGLFNDLVKSGGKRNS